MINFDSLPKDKPNNNSIEPGRYNATVFKCEMRESKTNEGTKYLNVSFKCGKHGFVNENYFDSDKPFLQYKLSRLLIKKWLMQCVCGLFNDIQNAYSLDIILVFQ